LKVHHKKENISSCTISNENEKAITREDINQVLSKVRSNINIEDEAISVVRSNENSSSIEIKYKSYDLTKPEIKQIETKTALIELNMTNDGGITIRAPANEFSDKVVEKIKSSIVKEVGNEIKVKEIDLSSIVDSSLVTKFFDYLINNIDGFDFDDVTNVKLFHPTDKTDEDDDLVTSSIKKAMLHGKGVLSSIELKSLFNRGFHVSNIQWTSKENFEKGDVYSFEASLKYPEEKRGFTYQVRSVFRYSDNTGDNKKSSSKVSNIEKQTIYPKIDKSASIAFEKVLKDQES
jgi:hypothetical protein